MHVCSIYYGYTLHWFVVSVIVQCPSNSFARSMQTAAILNPKTYSTTNLNTAQRFRKLWKCHSQICSYVDFLVAETEPKLICDGCTDTISREEALNCSICKVYLHCYCAGVPRSRFSDILPTFICIPCSLSSNNSTVAELRSEIAALKSRDSRPENSVA